MKNRIVTEYVEFNTIAGTDEAGFIHTVDQLETQFHSLQQGFIDTELCRIGENHWVMIQHWATLEDCKTVVRLMMQEPLTAAFRSALDPTTVKMKLMEQFGTWRQSNMPD